MALKTQEYSAGERRLMRRFIVEGLPEGVEPSDPHLQVFENFVGNDGLRLRKTRDPETDRRRYFIFRTKPDERHTKLLNDESLELSFEEYELFTPLRGRETRFNRYEHQAGGTVILIDIYLGDLWGLNIASFSLEDQEAAEPVATPPRSVIEISGDPFFAESKIADCRFGEIREFLQSKAGTAGIG